MLNAPGIGRKKIELCWSPAHTFIAGENRDKQREEEQREKRDHDVMISLGWYHLVEVSLIEVCEEERTNVNKERTKMNGKGEEQREDEHQGLVPVTSS
jgi:hypothetical protein